MRKCYRCKGQMFAEVYSQACDECAKVGAKSCDNCIKHVEYNCLQCGNVENLRPMKRGEYRRRVQNKTQTSTGIS